MPARATTVLSIDMLKSRPQPLRRPPFVFPSAQDRPEAGIEDRDGNRRCRIWDLSGSLHCSIVGTCLTTAELRHILIKLKMKDAETMSEHDLHTVGVSLAGKHDTGGKLLQKTLDRRHQATVKRFARAADPAALRALWEEALAQGDIPGAYWATMTHPAATEDIIRDAFGAVHMLSHMVGAANRADIRRLRELEEANAALREKVERQQRQLHEGFARRDATIRQLNDLVARNVLSPAAETETDVHDEAQRQLIADLGRRLESETLRRERVERRLEGIAAARREADRLLEREARECHTLRAELASLEARLAALMQPETGRQELLQLSGATILYVGGLHHQVAQLRALVEQAGGALLHHDGGVENSLATLPGLISRADRAMFPVDCVSHSAAGTIKRLCRQMEKPYAPLRTASLTCLLAALGGEAAPAIVAAE